MQDYDNQLKRIVMKTLMNIAAAMLMMVTVASAQGTTDEVKESVRVNLSPELQSKGYEIQEFMVSGGNSGSSAIFIANKPMPENAVLTAYGSEGQVLRQTKVNADFLVQGQMQPTILKAMVPSNNYHYVIVLQWIPLPWVDRIEISVGTGGIR
jgi:hypothetical protein